MWHSAVCVEGKEKVVPGSSVAVGIFEHMCSKYYWLFKPYTDNLRPSDHYIQSEGLWAHMLNQMQCQMGHNSSSH